MGNLLTFDFWFNYDFVALLPIYEKLLYASVILFIILTVVGAILKRKKNIYTGLWLNIYYLAFTNAIIGLILAFFYFEQISFFSARAWLLFWFVEIIIWLIDIAKQILKVFKKKPDLTAEMEYNKYLPK